MRLLRLSLLLGGLFNLTMGLIFLNNRLLQAFFSWAQALESRLFQSTVVINFPADPLHQLLIHGFGAGVIILGTTLLYSSKNPGPMLPFIFFDGLGRLLFGSIMFYYVIRFSLMRTIFLFGMVEILFAVIYIWGSYNLSRKWGVESSDELEASPRG